MHPLRFPAVALLAGLAAAQADLSSRLRPVTAPLRDAGVYHVATGTWTRSKAPVATLGSEVIYDNTCSSGYYATMSPGEVYTDEGRVPSTTSPDTAESKPGCSGGGCPAGYRVNGFQIAYCTDTFASERANLTFYCRYMTCDDPTIWSSQVVAAFAITGLPATTIGSPACWLVTLDLEAPPQSTDLSFVLGADADGAYGTIDTFGWSVEYPNTVGASGPFIAGDPASCSRWGNTIWDPIQPSPEAAGTGMGTENLFRLDGGTAVNPGCYSFGSMGIPVPMSSFHLRLYSTNACDEPQDTIHPYCFGTTQSCPCGATDQAGTDGLGGCDASWGTGGLRLAIEATGPTSVSNDTDGVPQVGARTTRGPSSGSSHLIFQGTSQTQVAFGDGLRCVGGELIRLGVRNFGAAGGFPAGELEYAPGTFGPGADQPLATAGGLAGPATRTYQGWFRNVADFCVVQGFNLTNAVEVIWLP